MVCRVVFVKYLCHVYIYIYIFFKILYYRALWSVNLMKFKKQVMGLVTVFWPYKIMCGLWYTHNIFNLEDIINICFCLMTKL